MAAFLAIVPAAAAQPMQQSAPHIGYVYPAGGRHGSTFTVTVGGQFLEGVSTAHVSGAGVEATVIEHTKPMTPREFNLLRDKAKELQDRKSAAAKDRGQGGSPATTKPAWTADDENMLAELRKKIATFIRRPANPAIAETVTLQVTMAPDAEPGERELRLGTPSGLTNPLVFCVGQLPEFSEEKSKGGNEPGDTKAPKPGQPPRAGKPPKTGKEPKPSKEPPTGKGPPTGKEPKASIADTEMRITLPATVNGQIMPGDVDRYQFKARKAEWLVVAANARALIPYLPDAVPGWFQATLALYDAKGKELAYDDDYRFHPDPVLFYQIPRDGDYVIEIRDAIYRGREDFVYRVALGELPFVTGIFPLGGKAGDQTTVEVRGWNLPLTSLTQEAKDKAPGIVQVSVSKGELLSNRVPFVWDTLPECLEKEPNNQPDGAQPVKLPLIVNGRIGSSGDRDVFRFEGRAGEEVVAEVYARRLDSPLDSVLKLTDAAGRQLAFNDDHEDKGTGLNTHHADSWLRATLPANGTYYVHLGDAQDKGGPEYTYRLRISPPRPDFELRVVPSSINVRGCATIPLTVHALRKDGFTGEIALALKDAPAGFVLSGARVPANQDQVRLTLTVPPKPQNEPLGVSLEGRATIQGRQVVRPAVPAEDTMQAFAYRHLVPAKELLVAVSGRGPQKRPVRILGPTPVKIPAGGVARVRVGIPTSAPMGKIHLELSEPPEGIAIQSLSSVGEGTEIVLQSDAQKVKPGSQGNLIVSIFVERTTAPADEKARANRRRMPIGTLPAIPFEIAAR